jgi:hypothetical protein
VPTGPLSGLNPQMPGFTVSLFMEKFTELEIAASALRMRKLVAVFFVELPSEKLAGTFIVMDPFFQ